MLVKFQNLLEKAEDDMRYGILYGNTVICLCGCDGSFEHGDYKIIATYPNADIDSMIQHCIKHEKGITLRESLQADFTYELDHVDFSSKAEMDDSFRYMTDQLEIQYQNRKKGDFSISQEEYNDLHTMLEKEIENLRECYFCILDFLSK